MTAILSFIFKVFAYLPIGVNRALGRAVGWLLFMLNTRERRTTETNLKLCFPELSNQDRARLAKASMLESFQMVDVAGVWFRDLAWRQRHTLNTINTDLRQSAIESSRGVIMLMPHFGNYDMAGLCAAEGQDSLGVYRPPKIAALDPITKAGRSIGPQSRMVPASAKGVMAVFKALKKGQIAVILPDQVPVEGGVYASFYGYPAYTMTLIHKLIKKTNALVLLTYAIRRPGGFEVGYLQPDADIYSDNELTSVNAMNKSIENLIALAPEQYQWEYKRFKHQADGSDWYAE